MRVQGVVLFIVAFVCNGASASSIEVLEPSASSPSVILLGELAAADPSIVAATPIDGPAPSIIALADTPAGDMPSIIVLGDPAPADEDLAAAPPPAASQRVVDPMVIRGGEVGSASVRPSSASPQAAAEPGTTLLDPNDKGTPSKRKALKRQAERLAREAAAAAENPQPDPSSEPVPLGR